MEFRSREGWRGIPVVAVSFRGRAIEMVAVGRIAVGVVAVGLHAAGVIG
jgi:hypothetical protein